MTSKIKVNILADGGDNSIITSDGAGAVTFGTSGNSITIPSGVTITNNGTQTGFGENMTPAFYATKSSTQNISNNSYTKVSIDTEIFDTNSAYDNSTNYRFTVPSGEAGKYYFFCGVTLGHTAKFREGLLALYVNGSQQGRSRLYNYFGTSDVAEDWGVNTTSVFDLSVGDYVEVFGYINSGTATQARFISNGTYFGGYKLIGA
jgi:hypothetical protein